MPGRRAMRGYRHGSNPARVRLGRQRVPSGCRGCDMRRGRPARRSRPNNALAHAGRQATLTLRDLMQSKRFDQAWQLLSNTTAEGMPQTTSYHYRAIGVSDQFEAYTQVIRKGSGCNG